MQFSLRARNVGEVYVLDDPDGLAGNHSPYGSNFDRVALSPPVTSMQTCFDTDIVKVYILDGARIPYADIDSAVRIINNDIAEVVVRHVVLIPATNTDTA